jgi:choline dehydrogenase
MGFPRISDINAPEAARDGLTGTELLWENKERVSTLAFLTESNARERENLTICTGAIVSRITFSGKEPRAEGVQFQDFKAKSGKVFSAKPKREIILSAGAISSPQTLMFRLEPLRVQYPGGF